ncbi:uncharacterized protein B0H64DRAFT_423265 [Chaetomium fimeti]|uniref:Telomeric single stranded DNA binding POT1/Cdc13 domain-containing protein n=1 Tax=Chaetomium fimeti TaxID=1854472 RepID=A0AAE0HHX7_9PEZI|nr:hypothetical protein B0H64DRAFT_423265 [Chaetomium fimeti]
MATANGNSVAPLASLSATPIAQLNPDLPNQASRSVRGEVTITWPYNSVTKKLAFLIAEPDVRLRRAKGQIRIELHGPSAKAASESGLGASDELLFSLAGAEWSKDASPGRIPGARVEWQLQFNQKLALQVKFGETGEIKHINIDGPTAEQPDDLMTEAPRIATPEPEPTLPEIPTTVRKISEFTANEYHSPAFVKRARLSYGALFEGGFDIFEEDGGVKGRGRKRTRFGRDSSAWRYSSQSPSPERDTSVSDAMDEDPLEDATPRSQPKPQMADEGCQTVEAETETSDATLPRWEKIPVPPETPTPLSRKPSVAPTQRQQTATPELIPVTTIAQDEPSPAVQQQAIDIPSEEPVSATESALAAEPDRPSPWPPTGGEEPQEQSRATDSQQNMPAESNAETATSALFGPRSFTSSFSSFGASAPARVETNLSLAEQVRFGFSHIPQTTRSPSPQKPEPAPETTFHQQDPYPMAFLDNAPALPKRTEMDTYPNAVGEEEEVGVQGETMPPEPPAVEIFGEGQWEMSTQPPHYNMIEGGHFGADTLGEGTRVTAGQPSLHADNISPGAVPEGFASYGHENMLDRHQEQPLQPALPHEDEPLVENEDTISEDEVGVEEEKDEDAESDEYAYGEQVEEGDYDQRNYDIPSDDEDDLSEEDEEVELETEARYGNGETYDEDGEGEEWDEEEDYESEEEDYEEEEDDDDDVSRYQPRRPAAPAPTGEPVVISLLSDSEDEDEPVPQPRQPAPTPQTAHAPPPAESSEAASSPKREDFPGVLKTIETNNTGEERAPTAIFAQTDVFDFAARGSSNIIQRPTAPSAGPDANTGTPQFTTQFPGSFEVSSARDESYISHPEVAPSEGSLALPFVSETKPPPAPSETSSEGLFISQIRSRSPVAEDQQSDADSTDEPERTTEGSTDGDTEPGAEKARAQDEFSNVEEPEEDEAATPTAKLEDDDTSLPDADDSSFSSQVEMPEVDEAATPPAEPRDDDTSLSDADNLSFSSQVEVLEEDEAPIPPAKSRDDDSDLPDANDLSFSSQIEMPEEFGESEDEYMSVDENVPSNKAATVDAVISTLEVEEVISEEDVEMVDAISARVESASPEKVALSPSREGLGETSVVSSLVITEVTPEVVPTAAADGPLPDVDTSEQQQREQQVPPPISVDRELAAAESLQQMAEDVADSAAGISGAAAESQEEAAFTFSFETQVDFAAPKVPELSQESPLESPVEDAVTSPVGSQPETGESFVVDGGISNEADGVSASPVETSAEAQTSDVLDAELQAQPPTVVTPDGIPGEDEAEHLMETEKSQQTQEEAETVQQPSSPTAEDLEDETMILEQLTQEQQQSFEAEAAEYQSRVRSTTPDLSVQLARQAVASKRHKKAAAEPVRTSARLNRARSSSLRSNGTNGTPEKEKAKEEDNSVTLARAALASPSKRVTDAATEADGTTTAPTTSATTATALKADLTKRLRTELPECVALKSLRTHLDKFPNVVAVVTSSPPTQPARAKGGPREYFMSFRVTDPSAAPSAVVEVHLYRPHKDSLPVVRPGDVVLLQRFQVKALSKRGWGLRTGMDSAWAVWEGGGGGGHGGGDGRGEGEGDGVGDSGASPTPAPQIKGPPVEDWEAYVGYVGKLREWFALVVGDAAARGKLERADRKMAEAK